MAKIDHSESIQTTSVGKYWKSWKTAKIGHSEPIWITSVGKYWKSCKMSKIGHSESILTTSVGKVAFATFPILEKLQNGKNWPYQNSCHLKTISRNNQKSNQDI